VRKLLATVQGLIPAALVAAVVAGVVVLAMSIFSSDDDDERGGGAALALGPAESSWVPGQKSLTSYPEFAALFGRALPQARQRRAEREKALDALERRKIAAKKRAEAAARRRYEAAKRRAQRLYRLALKRAEERRQRQLERIARAKARARRLARERAEKLKVRPGDECGLEGVKQKFDCETGKLPDPAEPK
jgi:hypothetical protein